MYYNKRLHPRQARRVEIAYISDDCEVHSGGSRLSLDRISRKSSTPTREIPARKVITVVDEDPTRDHRFDALFCGTDRLNYAHEKL